MTPSGRWGLAAPGEHGGPRAKASVPHWWPVERGRVSEEVGHPGLLSHTQGAMCAWLWAQLSTRRDVPFAAGDARIKK